jgi:uncharacterized protein (TIGR02246 family)
MTAQEATGDRDEAAIQALYRSILEGWNARSGSAFAAPFAADGTVIGYDGSVHSGQADIGAELDRIFADHPTARYVARIKSVRLINPDTALLRAITGLVPPGASDVRAELNAHQTLVASRVPGDWQAVLLQNTPAQFHGRPELVESMTEELREELRAAG